MDARQTRAAKRKVEHETKPSKRQKPSTDHATRREKRAAAAAASSGEGAPLTRRRTRAGGESLLAETEPERLLHHQRQAGRRRSSPKTAPAAEPPAEMEHRGAGGHGDIPDEDELGRTASAMEGLLRRLGAGLGGVFAGAGSARVRAIISQLRDEGDEMTQLAGLTELCEYLSISTEDSLMAFPTEQVVPLLVNMLGFEHNPDMMLLAARALTFLADVYPPACSSIIRHGAVPAFCARLLTIEFIDLAEQSLQALEKLSHEHPGSLLRHGGLVAVLSYLDFFPTGVQRTAVATAANICRGLSAEHADAVATAAPILIGLLQYQDAKLVDTACLALTRIAEAFSRSPAQLEMLCGFGLITSINQMVRVEENGSMTTQLQVSTFYGLIKLLATCAAGSHVVAETLLKGGISTTLHNLLATSALFNATGASPSNVLRSADQLGDLVTLISQLLPPIPDATAAPPESVGAGREEGGSAGQDKAAAAEESCQRTKFLKENPALLQSLANELLPPLLKVYSSSVTPVVKRQCLTSIAKMLYFNQPATLEALTEDLPVSSFVAALLRAKDATVAAFGMQMAEILMEKLPDLFRQFFLKEGVMHAMDQLAGAAGAAGKAAGEGGAAGGEDLAGGASGESSGRRAASATGSRGGAGGSGMRRSRSGGGGAGEAEGAGPSTSAKAPATGDALRSGLAERARRFKKRHFTDAEGNELGCATEGVKALTAICQRLPDPSAVEALMAALAGTGNASVSTFELLSSGAVKALKDYLHGIDLAAKAPVGASPLPLLQRLAQFAAVTLPPGSGGAPPLGILVSKMLGALATCETFAVQMNPIRAPPAGMYDYYGRGGGGLQRTTSGTSSSLAAGLAALSNPLKVRLMRSGDDTTLRDFNGVVVIDALASMTQLEEFLWPRVCPTSSAAVAAGANARDDSRSRLAQPHGAAGAAAGAPGGAGAASVNNAAVAAAAAKGRGAGGGDSTSPASGTAAAGAGGSAARPGSGGGSRPASQNRPIPQPQGRRMTRAQARAAAEAEVAANSHREEDQQQQQQSPGQEPDKAMDEGGDPMFEDTEQMVIGAEDDYDSEEDIPTDEDMDDAGYVEGDGYDDEEDDELGIGSLAVHDMHLAEPEAAGSPPAGAGAGGRGASRHGQAQRPGSAGGEHTAGVAAAAAGRGESGLAEPRAGAGQTYAQATGGAGAGPSGNTGGQQQQQQQHGGHRGGHHHHHHEQQQQQPEPQLAFYLGGKLLGPGSTIFQAVQRHLEEKGNSRGVSSIWSEVHTLTYRPYAAAMRLKESEAATSIIAAGAGGLLRRGPSSFADVESGHDHDDVSVSPLNELVNSLGGSAVGLAGAAGDELAAPREALDVLAVLQVLEALNRLAPHLQSYLEGRAGAVREAAAPPLGSVPRDQFLSAKLAPKLSQQLKDVLSICGGTLPAWCRPLVTRYKFLFPFETRRRFFYCTSFGLARALGYLQQVHASEHGPGSAAERDARELRIGRMQRQKVRISRRHLLESALKVFELYAAAKSQLEIEYFGEVGTGLGPTLEFYTLLSHELQRKSLGLWRHTEALGGSPQKGGPEKGGSGGSDAVAVAKEEKKAVAQARSLAEGGPGPVAGELEGAELNPNESVHSSDLVRAPQGLFPAPLPPSERGAAGKAVRYYSLLGKVTAKALQDGRLLDLPLSPVFYRLALGGRVDLFDIRKFDTALGASVEKLDAAYHAHVAAGRRGPLLVDGCPVEDLCLSFVLPGYPAYQLAPNGAEVTVTAGTMKEYIDAVVDATLGAGVSAQVEAFREGFNAIFPLDSLAYFYEDEIEAMLCGTGEAWSVDQLTESVKFDHGYTSQSAAVRHFLEVLSELDALDQRRFLRFVTGSPRLPPGGLAALQPRLTVVRKLSAAVGDAAGTSVPGSLPSLGPGSVPAGKSLADGDLPSVMTCVNYIKLPPYSSKEVCRERLLFAIREGQGSFDLS